MDEAVRPFTDMRSRCRSSRADVTFPSSIVTKLASLLNYSAVHELLLRNRKVLLLEADNPLPFKLLKFLEFLLISSWRHS
ncbi:hypothetical protein TNCV_3163451 [Trichonephila clavipes]|nr:hypothetical protein TNCV_3163451 [Trichonephila clavipes]